MGNRCKSYAEKLTLVTDETDPKKFIQELLMIVNIKNVAINSALTKQIVFLDSEDEVKEAINIFMIAFAGNE